METALLTAAWIGPYCLVWLIHGTWWLPAFGLIDAAFNFEKSWPTLAIMATGYIMVVTLCWGCPLTYVHEWIEVQMHWRVESTYTFYACWLFRYGIAPLQSLLVAN